jgi:hypothetical protein
MAFAGVQKEFVKISTEGLAEWGTVQFDSDPGTDLISLP